LGGLGANVGTDSWQQAKVRRELASDYIKKIKESYTREINTGKTSPYNTRSSRSYSPYSSPDLPSKRERALKYAEALRLKPESPPADESELVKNLRHKHELFEKQIATL